MRFLWARRSEPGYDNRGIGERREELERIGDLAPLPDGVTAQARTIAGVDGLWIAPSTDGTGVHEDGHSGHGRTGGPAGLLYLHGGGYVRGSSHSHRHVVARLAVRCGLPAFAPDYRLAPEHPFPAALDDAEAVLSGVAEELRVPVSSVVVAGDSAGGGLAVSAMVRRRDAGDPLPALAALFSPWVDLRAEMVAARATTATDPLLSLADLHFAVDAYGPGRRTEDPLLSPVLADLAGLPPLVILVAAEELLVDDALNLASQAAASSVATELVVEPGLFHAWPVVPGIPEADAAADFVAGSVRRRLGAG